MQKTPKKNVTMGIGFNLRSIYKLVLVTILNYKIVPMNEFFFFDRGNLVCLACYITSEKIHKAHFGIYTCYNMKNRFFENTYSTFRYFILVTI